MSARPLIASPYTQRAWAWNPLGNAQLVLESPGFLAAAKESRPRLTETRRAAREGKATAGESVSWPIVVLTLAEMLRPRVQTRCAAVSLQVSRLQACQRPAPAPQVAPAPPRRPRRLPWLLGRQASPAAPRPPPLGNPPTSPAIIVVYSPLREVPAHTGAGSWLPHRRARVAADGLLQPQRQHLHHSRQPVRALHLVRPPRVPQHMQPWPPRTPPLPTAEQLLSEPPQRQLRPVLLPHLLMRSSASTDHW
mmetsp:Transcript_10792/g.20034  ORF Transcript_10792/g.20034 Transcript_10792/m.20034 type:complete len:250 (-) Transcript_10792:2827-3576(-)